MENVVTEQKYELVVILDAHLNEGDKDAICKEVAEAATKAGVKIINNTVWMEKQKFAFEIKKKTEGTYYLFNLESGGSAVTKLRLALKLNEKILRFAFNKL